VSPARRAILMSLAPIAARSRRARGHASRGQVGTPGDRRRGRAGRDGRLAPWISTPTSPRA
jgi:hypothetical protein